MGLLDLEIGHDGELRPLVEAQQHQRVEALRDANLCQAFWGLLCCVAQKLLRLLLLLQFSDILRALFFASGLSASRT